MDRIDNADLIHSSQCKEAEKYYQENSHKARCRANEDHHLNVRNFCNHRLFKFGTAVHNCSDKIFPGLAYDFFGCVITKSNRYLSKISIGLGVQAFKIVHEYLSCVVLDIKIQIVGIGIS